MEGKDEGRKMVWGGGGRLIGDLVIFFELDKLGIKVTYFFFLLFEVCVNVVGFWFLILKRIRVWGGDLEVFNLNGLGFEE